MPPGRSPLGGKRGKVVGTTGPGCTGTSGTVGFCCDIETVGSTAIVLGVPGMDEGLTVGTVVGSTVGLVGGGAECVGLGCPGRPGREMPPGSVGRVMGGRVGTGMPPGSVQGGCVVGTPALVGDTVGLVVPPLAGWLEPVVGTGDVVVPSEGVGNSEAAIPGAL